LITDSRFIFFHSSLFYQLITPPFFMIARCLRDMPQQLAFIIDSPRYYYCRDILMLMLLHYFDDAIIDAIR